MRDRLIELLCGHYMNTQNDAMEVADYLLANGVIVPPCKVGDVIYDIHSGKVFGGEIAMISFVGDHLSFMATGCRYFLDVDIGKTVFLTKEEAEQALKGGEG